jgi:hypothetical protein
MYQVRDWLYMGNIYDTQALDWLHQQGIGAMLEMATPIKHPYIRTFYLSVAEDVPIPEEYLQMSMAFVRNQHVVGKNLLIACNTGNSRSATFCVAALKEIEELSLFDAYKVVHQANPKALPHKALWTSLCDYYNEPVNHIDIVLHAIAKPTVSNAAD